MKKRNLPSSFEQGQLGCTIKWNSDVFHIIILCARAANMSSIQDMAVNYCIIAAKYMLLSIYHSSIINVAAVWCAENIHGVENMRLEDAEKMDTNECCRNAAGKKTFHMITLCLSLSKLKI